MSVEVRVLEAITPAEAAKWLGSLATDTLLLCPFTAQFIKWPELAGAVDPTWIATHSSRYQDQSHLPRLGTPLIKSRFSDESIPMSMLRVIHPVQGEKEEIQKEKSLVIDLRQKLAVAKNLIRTQKAQLEAEKQRMSSRIEELKETVESYAEMMTAMQLCIETRHEVHKEPPDKELVRRLEEQENIIKKLRGSEMRLSSEQITLRQEAEQDKVLIEQLQKKVEELTKKLNEREVLGKLGEPKEPKEPKELNEPEPSRKRARRVTIQTPSTSEEPAHAETDEELEEPKEHIEKQNYVTEDAEEVKKVLGAHNLRAVHKYHKELNGLTLFDSISDQLERDCGIKQSCTELLSNLIAFIELNRETYEKKLMKTEKKPLFSLYLESIRNGIVSKIAVEALANQLQRNIWVFTSADILKFEPISLTSTPLKIAYFTGEHNFYRSTESLETVIDISDDEDDQ